MNYCKKQLMTLKEQSMQNYKIDIVIMVRARFKEPPKDAADEWKRQLFQIKLDVYAQKVRLWLLGKLGKIGMAARIGSN